MRSKRQWLSQSAIVLALWGWGAAASAAPINLVDAFLDPFLQGFSDEVDRARFFDPVSGNPVAYNHDAIDPLLIADQTALTYREVDNQDLFAQTLSNNPFFGQPDLIGGAAGPLELTFEYQFTTGILGDDDEFELQIYSGDIGLCEDDPTLCFIRNLLPNTEFELVTIDLDAVIGGLVNFGGVAVDFGLDAIAFDFAFDDDDGSGVDSLFSLRNVQIGPPPPPDNGGGDDPTPVPSPGVFSLLLFSLLALALNPKLRHRA